MEITSFSFAGFTLAAFIVYHLLPRQAKPVWLLLASLAFYALWDWRFGLILLALTNLNFLIAQSLEKNESKALMWGGIALNISFLFLFKYTDLANSLLDFISFASGYRRSSPIGLSLLIPIGLSFYLMQVISSFVDVRLKRTPAEKSWLFFTLYLLYFPKLLSGPIERARKFIPQLKEPKVVDAELLSRSFSLITLGLVRKLFIADSLVALIPEDVFATPGAYPAQFLVTWLLGYAFALYNDFTGYTQIVRGVSGLFGIELSRNFMRPYFSQDFTDFWKRWHISLSEWLRDYIFFPTTRALMKFIPNRKHLVNLVVPPMLTMLVSGLWHGLSWHMLFWGGLHGVYQVVERLLTMQGIIKRPAERSTWRKWLAGITVFLLAALAWLPFRMELPAAWAYLTGMLNPHNWADPNIRRAASDVLHGKGFWAWPSYNLPDPRIFLVILPGLWLDWRQEAKNDELFFQKWGKWGKALLLAAAILALLLVSGADQQVPFVYQGF